MRLVEWRREIFWDKVFNLIKSRGQTWQSNAAWCPTEEAWLPLEYICKCKHQSFTAYSHNSPTRHMLSAWQKAKHFTLLNNYWRFSFWHFNADWCEPQAVSNFPVKWCWRKPKGDVSGQRQIVGAPCRISGRRCRCRPLYRVFICFSIHWLVQKRTTPLCSIPEVRNS